MRTICAILLVAAGAFAADRSNPEDPGVLFDSVRKRVLAYLTELPNYTCHEVINRLVRRSGTWTNLDTVEVEVAIIGREERFARPGESEFIEGAIDRLVPHGTIGNGVFWSHVDVVFARNTVSFKYAGTGKKDGHHTVRYDFSVPVEQSQFVVKDRKNEALVPYDGSVWVDATSLDMVRLEVSVKHVPSRVAVRGVHEVVQYQLMRIGEADALLPVKSEISTTDDLGNQSLNLQALRNCREFKSQSIVKYGAPTQ